MEKLKHSKIGIISFGFAITPIIYAIAVSISDILHPVYSDFYMHLVTISMCIMYVISIISFILGIVAIAKKGYKKVLPISSVIISSLIILIPVFILIHAVMDVSNIWVAK